MERARIVGAEPFSSAFRSSTWSSGCCTRTAIPRSATRRDCSSGCTIAQLFLIGGLAYLFWLLVEGLDSRAARVARALILPFVIVYTAVDAVLGIAWGIVTQKANELPVADQAAAGRLVDELLEPEPLGYVLYFGAGLLWLAVALAVVTALWNSAPRPALALMAIGAACSRSVTRDRWGRSG